jgi:hypothetical protein
MGAYRALVRGMPARPAKTGSSSRNHQRYLLRDEERLRLARIAARLPPMADSVHPALALDAAGAIGARR